MLCGKQLCELLCGDRELASSSGAQRHPELLEHITAELLLGGGGIASHQHQNSAFTDARAQVVQYFFSYCL